MRRFEIYRTERVVDSDKGQSGTRFNRSVMSALDGVPDRAPRDGDSDAGIIVLKCRAETRTWMAGTSLAMTPLSNRDHPTRAVAIDGG